VVANINEATEQVDTPEAEPVAQSMSADDVENIINARLQSFSQAVEGLAEMTKVIAESNAQLVNELSSLKSEFETFKAQPSVETRENEKFSKVGNLTTRQAFLLKNK
jgi:predicted RNase H-like nuclease (RuvC/YqgF family)